MIEVCMFDMGGVVDQFSSERMEKRLLRYFGVSDADSFEKVAPGIESIKMSFMSGLVSLEQFWKEFERLSGIKVPHEEGLYTKFFNPVKIPKTIRLIQDLKASGMRVVAATNVEPPHHAWHSVHNDYDLFDAVYASDELHASKPDPLFFTKILAFEGKSPSCCFFTDDKAENVQTACDLGIQGYQFINADDLRTHLECIRVIKS